MAQSKSLDLFLSWCSSTWSMKQNFSWFFLWSTAYDRATSRRCAWCHQPQRGHEYVTAGQPPLRTRQEPLRASRLAPSQQHKVAQSNSEVEASCWFLEQPLLCATRQVQVVLVFREDLGGSKSDAVPTSTRSSTLPWPLASSSGGFRWPPLCSQRDTHSLLRNVSFLPRALRVPKVFLLRLPQVPRLSFSSLGDQVNLRRLFSVTTVVAHQLLYTLRAYCLTWTFLVAVLLCPLRHPALCFLLWVHCRCPLAHVVLCSRPWWPCHGGMFRMSAVLHLV